MDFCSKSFCENLHLKVGEAVHSVRSFVIDGHHLGPKSVAVNTD